MLKDCQGSLEEEPGKEFLSIEPPFTNCFLRLFYSALLLLLLLLLLFPLLFAAELFSEPLGEMEKVVVEMEEEVEEVQQQENDVESLEKGLKSQGLVMGDHLSKFKIVLYWVQKCHRS